MKTLKSYTHVRSRAAVGSLKEVDSLTSEVAMAHTRVLVVAEAREDTHS